MGDEANVKTAGGGEVGAVPTFEEAMPLIRTISGGLVMLMSYVVAIMNRHKFDKSQATDNLMNTGEQIVELTDRAFGSVVTTEDSQIA